MGLPRLSEEQATLFGARGALLVVACVAGRAVLPKAFHADWLPMGEGDLHRRLRDEPSGMLSGQNARGSTVVVLWARPIGS
jgi:hypothetical protein